MLCCEKWRKRICNDVPYLDDKLILECTNSLVEPEDTEFRITSFSPQVDAFRFYPNREYYYVGTYIYLPEDILDLDYSLMISNESSSL